MTSTKNKDVRKVLTKSAIEMSGVEDKVLKWFEQGINYTDMSKMLKQEGIDISNYAIGRWFKKRKQKTAKAFEMETAKKFEVMILDYRKEITTILDEVKEMKNIAKDAKNLDMYSKLVGRLYQGLELLAKLMGDIKPTNHIDINILINEINKKMVDTKKENKVNLFSVPEIIDIEAEIIEDDSKEAEKIKV